MCSKRCLKFFVVVIPKEGLMGGPANPSLKACSFIFRHFLAILGHKADGPQKSIRDFRKPLIGYKIQVEIELSIRSMSTMAQNCGIGHDDF